jgi:hypothetical protein
MNKLPLDLMAGNMLQPPPQIHASLTAFIGTKMVVLLVA